jgi:hypothetical protein
VVAVTSRRAEHFAAVLDGRATADDMTVGPLVALAGALGAVGGAATLSPSPDFRAALRQRLVAVAAVQGIGATAAPAPAPRLRELGSSWRVQRRMAVLAGGAAAMTAIAGVGVGASRSLPGQPFYGVKRATEQVQLATTFGTEARGKRHLEFARTRLAEVQALAGESTALPALTPGRPSAAAGLPAASKVNEIAAALRDMDSETRLGSADLLAVFAATHHTEALSALNSFTRTQWAQLRALVPALPVAVRPAAIRSIQLLVTVATRTGHAAASSGTPQQPGSGGGSSPTPGSGSTSTPGTPTKPAGSGTPSGSPGGGSAPSQLPTTPSVPVSPSLPSTVPTIPPLPVPVPTKLPTALPTSLPTLPGLGN